MVKKIFKKQNIPLLNKNLRSYPLYYRKLKLKKQGNKCANKNCKWKVCYPKYPIWAFEGDHIIEVSDGGKTTLDNLQVLCIGCHKIKSRISAYQRRMTRFTKLEEKIINFLQEFKNSYL